MLKLPESKPAARPGVAPVGSGATLAINAKCLPLFPHVVTSKLRALKLVFPLTQVCLRLSRQKWAKTMDPNHLFGLVAGPSTTTPRAGIIDFTYTDDGSQKCIWPSLNVYKTVLSRYIWRCWWWEIWIRGLQSTTLPFWGNSDLLFCQTLKCGIKHWSTIEYSLR